VAEITSLLDLVQRILDHIEDGTLRSGFEEPVHRGSASGFTCVVGDERDPESLLLVVRLQVVRVPAGMDAAGRLRERLLALNHQLRGRAAFSESPEGIVCLTAGRPVEDLDPGEVIDLILWTSEQADAYDDILIGEFGDDVRI